MKSNIIHRFVALQLLFLLGFCHVICAQVIPHKDGLTLAIKPVGDQLIVRWVPTSERTWLRMKDGYALLGWQSYTREEGFSKRSKMVYSDTIRIWPMESFENIVGTIKENPYVMLAGYLMHAPYESISGEKLKLSEMVDRKDELSNRFSSALFAADMDSLAANSLCMRSIISNFDPKKYYLISVYLVQENEIFNQTLEYDPEQTYSMTPVISKSEELEKSIVLSWDRAVHSSYFTAYWVERSKDGKTFSRLTESPYLHAFDVQDTYRGGDLIYIDSVENYQPYYYRIIGLDAFGYESPPSKTLRLMAKDRTPPPVPLDKKAELINNNMKVTWDFQDSPSDLSHFYIQYGHTIDGSFTNISAQLPKNIREFVHQSYKPTQANYYKVCAVDTAKNEICTSPISALFNDTFPPSPPTNIEARVDSQGIVTLTWSLGKEPDLKGYNVYFTNRYNGVSSILNKGIIRDTTYTDTISLNTLSENIFYRLTAVDVRDNISPFSDLIRVKRPDTIPPGPPLFNEYSTSGSGVLLKWSNPTTHDVKQIELWRRKEASKDIKIQTFSIDVEEYVDKDLEPNTYYTYSLFAVDDADLRQQSPTSLTIKSAYASDQTSIHLQGSQNEKSVILIVNLLNQSDQVSRIDIYKSINDQPYFTWKSLSNIPQESIADYSVKFGQKVSYKAMVRHQNGLKSSFSDPIDISLKE